MKVGKIIFAVLVASFLIITGCKGHCSNCGHSILDDGKGYNSFCKD